jgi:hypothetical protein
LRQAKSPIQSSPADCGASQNMIYRTRESGGPGPLKAVAKKKKKSNNYTQIGFGRISEMTACNEETKPKDSTLHDTLQLV